MLEFEFQDFRKTEGNRGEFFYPLITYCDCSSSFWQSSRIKNLPQPVGLAFRVMLTLFEIQFTGSLDLSQEFKRWIKVVYKEADQEFVNLVLAWVNRSWLMKEVLNAKCSFNSLGSFYNSHQKRLQSTLLKSLYRSWHIKSRNPNAKLSP